MKSTADVLVMVYLRRHGRERLTGAPAPRTAWRTPTYRLMVMKSKLQLDSPMSRAVARAAATQTGPFPTHATLACVFHPPPAEAGRCRRTCGRRSVEVVRPAQEHARLPRPAVQDPARDGRKREDDGDVHQGHEEGIVEVLGGKGGKFKAQK